MNNLPIQTYESVVQQRDALEKKLADVAAENTAMKENIENVLSHWAAAEPGDMSWMMDKCMPSLRDSCIETPVTEAFTRELMAKGADLCVMTLVSSDDDDFTDAPNICSMVAYQLRKGINDAQ